MVFRNWIFPQETMNSFVLVQTQMLPDMENILKHNLQCVGVRGQQSSLEQSCRFYVVQDQH